MKESWKKVLFKHYLFFFEKLMFDFVVDIILIDDFNSLYENNKFFHTTDLYHWTQTDTVAMKKISWIILSMSTCSRELIEFSTRLIDCIMRDNNGAIVNAGGYELWQRCKQFQQVYTRPNRGQASISPSRNAFQLQDKHVATLAATGMQRF